MLIEKKFKQGDVVSLKLISNEELVAKFVDEITDSVTITKPLLLNISIDERSGKPGLQMFPFFLLGADTDEKITLSRNHIIAMVLSRDDIKSGYIHNTTGIAIPTGNEKGLII